MMTETDVAGRHYVDVPFLGGVARLTLVPADQSHLKTLSLHLEARLSGQDPRPAVEIPASVAGELFTAALELVGSTPTSSGPTLPAHPTTSSLQLELDKAAPHLPNDLMLQPSLPGKALYWCQLGPHRVMKLEFRGVRPRRASAEALPFSLRHVALRLDPEPAELKGSLRLQPFTFFDPDRAGGDSHSFLAEDLQVEFVGQT
jgi:hypothetical protein